MPKRRRISPGEGSGRSAPRGEIYRRDQGPADFILQTGGKLDAESGVFRERTGKMIPLKKSLSSSGNWGFQAFSPGPSEGSAGPLRGNGRGKVEAHGSDGKARRLGFSAGSGKPRKKHPWL